jgi:hypothetical protein
MVPARTDVVYQVAREGSLASTNVGAPPASIGLYVRRCLLGRPIRAVVGVASRTGLRKDAGAGSSPASDVNWAR